MVATKDLKSLHFGECQFESGRGHHYFLYIYSLIKNIIDYELLNKYDFILVTQVDDGQYKANAIGFKK